MLRDEIEDHLHDDGSAIRLPIATPE